jgi:hypothetical protein
MILKLQMFYLYQTPKTSRIMAMNKNIVTYEGHKNNVTSLLKIQSHTIKTSPIAMLITGDK